MPKSTHFPAEKAPLGSKMQVDPPSRPSPPGPPPPLRIAHLVNVFVPAKNNGSNDATEDNKGHDSNKVSEFEWVLPITLETMRRSKAACKTTVQVELLTAQFASDHAAVPADFRPTPDLTRSVRDVWQDPALPPFPLIADLLQRLHDSTDADYLIYTNADIALQPRFYDAVAGFIRAGHDAFIINRRRIPGHYRHIDQLPEMYAHRGKPHPGFDCFVFHRDLFPKFVLGNVCIGIPFIEILLGQNLFAHARHFKLFDQEFLTFHIGEEVFKPRNPFLLSKNRQEYQKAIAQLWPILDSRKFPYANRWLPWRLVTWGLHPCIPIRLSLKLEWRRLWGYKAKVSAIHR